MDKHEKRDIFMNGFLIGFFIGGVVGIFILDLINRGVI